LLLRKHQTLSQGEKGESRVAMSFTNDLSTDIGKIRFHLADTDMASAVFSDEQLAQLLLEYEEVGRVVEACLLHKLALLSQPDFRADWLQVDLSSARKATADLLARKRQEFGLNSLSSGIRHFLRADSNEV